MPIARVFATSNGEISSVWDLPGTQLVFALHTGRRDCQFGGRLALADLPLRQLVIGLGKGRSIDLDVRRMASFRTDDECPVYHVVLPKEEDAFDRLLVARPG